MGEITKIRQEIRENGYLSVLQIVLKLAIRSPKINKDEIDYILKNLKCKDIRKVQYTSIYVNKLRLKDLYYYNPIPKRKIKKKKIFK